MSALGRTYRLTLLLVVACSGLSVAAVVDPTWFRSRVVSADGSVLYSSYGLARQCSSTVSDQAQMICESFPRDHDCAVHGQALCAIWRSAAFAMYLTLVVQACTVVAYLATIYGNQFALSRAWQLLAALVLAAAALQALATGSMATILETHGLFETGEWRIGRSWAYAVGSAGVYFMVVVVLLVVGAMTPTEFDVFYDPDLDQDSESESDDEHDDFYHYTRQQRRNFVKAIFGFN